MENYNNTSQIDLSSLTMIEIQQLMDRASIQKQRLLEEDKVKNKQKYDENLLKIEEYKHQISILEAENQELCPTEQLIPKIGNVNGSNFGYDYFDDPPVWKYVLKIVEQSPDKISALEIAEQFQRMVPNWKTKWSGDLRNNVRGGYERLVKKELIDQVGRGLLKKKQPITLEQKIRVVLILADRDLSIDLICQDLVSRYGQAVASPSDVSITLQRMFKENKVQSRKKDGVERYTVC